MEVSRVLLLADDLVEGVRVRVATTGDRVAVELVEDAVEASTAFVQKQALLNDWDTSLKRRECPAFRDISQGGTG